jgi:hypothetical protein
MPILPKPIVEQPERRVAWLLYPCNREARTDRVNGAGRHGDDIVCRRGLLTLRTLTRRANLQDWSEAAAGRAHVGRLPLVKASGGQ